MRIDSVKKLAAALGIDAPELRAAKGADWFPDRYRDPPGWDVAEVRAAWSSRPGATPPASTHVRAGAGARQGASETCAALGIDRATLTNWLAAGCPSEKVAGRRLFRVEELKAWRESSDRDPIDPATPPVASVRPALPGRVAAPPSDRALTLSAMIDRATTQDGVAALVLEVMRRHDTGELDTADAEFMRRACDTQRQVLAKRDAENARNVEDTLEAGTIVLSFAERDRILRDRAAAVPPPLKPGEGVPPPVDPKETA
jgi:hypothetical protein